MDDGTSLMKELWNSSPIGRLLEEISWEGRTVRAYRDGGRGRENVLTTEALMLLDFLPRHEFLGSIVRSARGADAVRLRLVEEIETAEVTLLPEQTFLASGPVVQPDAAIETPEVYALVEAKRIRTSSFQAPQLSREWEAARQAVGDRQPLLFLILGSPPPLAVKGNGRMDIPDAITLHLSPEADVPSREVIEQHVAWTTWDDIQRIVAEAGERVTGDDSTSSTVRRLSAALVRSIDWHR